MIGPGERGVSEALGFILVFAVILLSIGIVYTGGHSALTSYQQSDQVDNAERAFLGLSGAFDELERSNAESRTGEIRLAGGTLSVEESGSMTITIEEDDGNTWIETVPTGSLAYTYGGQAVAYERGAIIRQTGNGGLVQDSPSIRCADGRAVVSVVTVEPAGETEHISGDGSPEVRLQTVEQALLYSHADAEGAASVSIELEGSDYGEEWDRWFDSQEGCTDLESVYVRQTTVTVELFV